MVTAAALAIALLQAPMPANSGNSPATVDQKQSKAEQQHQKDIDNDIAMGKKFVIEVEKSEKLSDNKEYAERVNRIGQAIAEIARKTQVETTWGDKRLSSFEYTFKILKNPEGHEDEVNAFSLPGGFIYVYEGLVKYAESDDEIAAVLAHEISHAEMRHIATLSRETNKVQTPALIAILAAIASRNPDLIGYTIMSGLNVVQSFQSKWSVQAEQAADHGGFQYLLHSKYNPTAMLTFMERLAQDEHNDAARNMDWGIYQTHPPGKDRAAAILKDMRRYDISVQRSLVTTRFRSELRSTKEGIELWFNKRKLFTFGGADAQQRANEAAARVNKFFDAQPNMYDVVFNPDKGEILGRQSMLIDIRPEDAQVEKKSPDALGTAALQAIRGSIYNYAFNIWGTGR